MTRIIALGTTDIGLSILDSVDGITGELSPLADLPSLISAGSGGIIVGCNLFPYVARLNQIFGEWDNWTLHIKSNRREIIRQDRRMAIGTFLPIQFGFTSARTASGKRSRSRASSRLFQCMDLTDTVGVQTVTLAESLDYAESILELCAVRGIKYTAGRGALAARLLKASPAWIPGRRAAPEFVNDHARKSLPGNYYGLGTTPHHNHKVALYVDQTSAHHEIARTTPVPHPHHIRAQGAHREAEQKRVTAKWIHDSARIDHFLRHQYGLVAAVVSVNHIPDKRKHLFPPFMHEPGRRLEFFYTNEAHFFDGTHGAIEYLCAAWTSPVADDAVKEYAEFALANRKVAPGRKPVLLAAYGALALRTDRPATSYHVRHARGVVTEIPVAGKMVEFTRKRKPDQPQPAIVNVLARGVIEAETRSRSLTYAREIDSLGINVLSVYVDGIICETDRLPFLPAGWEIERGLTNVSFQYPNSFIADEIRKQPGIPRAPLAKFMTPVEEMQAICDKIPRESAHR